MSSTYGWLTESALAFERPVPLRGVSQQSQLLLASVIKKQQVTQQQQLAEQRPVFEAAARERKVFRHDAECDRKWTRPTKKVIMANVLAKRTKTFSSDCMSSAEAPNSAFFGFCLCLSR